MENTRDAIAKIEEALSTEIEAAALKRDLNKMVLALTESVKNLVVVAKEMADAIDVVAVAKSEAKTPAKKLGVAKAPASKPKKVGVSKRTQKTPIKPA